MAPSRGLVRCAQQLKTSTLRTLTTTTATLSGHNRWSKIKHDKGKVDALKNRQRSIFAHEIATCSKLLGPDVTLNPRLADLITKAKREGFAKTSIEAAVARGQGRSLSGASLESVTVDCILPGGVAVIVECDTDNKSRTLMEVRTVIKDYGGTATPSSYLFNQKGRILFGRHDDLDMDKAFDAALEAEATDVEEDKDGRLVVFTEPSDTKTVSEALATALGLEVAMSQIVWLPNEDTKVAVENDIAAQELSSFVDVLQDKEATVQAVSMNVAQGTLDIDTWKDLQSRLST